MRVLIGIRPGTYSNGASYKNVLLWNHFGTEYIPPRPVLRNAAEKVVEGNKDRFRAAVKNSIAAELHKTGEGKRIEQVLFASIGQQIIATAKRMIGSSEGLQHNAPRTVAKKGFDKPLYEDGTMMKNFYYKVDET